mmetsp:Transcript_669/g.1014  ORF Transcript_669/g.1014 Transcript_669/m.1014 type:complete len:128 (+) Transcript_669:1760-2143(+)
MFGTGGIGGNEWQTDVGLRQTIQFPLGLFGGFSQTLHGQIISSQIQSTFLFEILQQMFQQFFVKIFTTQHGISIGGLDFKDTSGNFQDGHIEGTTSQIKDGNGLSVGLVHTVGQGSGGGFIDNSQYI